MTNSAKYNPEKWAQQLEAHWRAIGEIRDALESNGHPEIAERLTKINRDLDDVTEEIAELPR